MFRRKSSHAEIGIELLVWLIPAVFAFLVAIVLLVLGVAFTTATLLWGYSLVPGATYSAWRHFSQRLACDSCGHECRRALIRVPFWVAPVALASALTVLNIAAFVVPKAIHSAQVEINEVAGRKGIDKEFLLGKWLLWGTPVIFKSDGSISYMGKTYRYEVIDGQHLRVYALPSAVQVAVNDVYEIKKIIPKHLNTSASYRNCDVLVFNSPFLGDAEEIYRANDTP
jgi:hypothetical protein